MKLRISRRADADLESIWQFIARDSADAADRVEAGLHDAMHTLALFPGMGHVRPDVSDPAYRFWTVTPYVIAYRLEEGALVVVRVLHGSRDFREHLS